MRFTNTAKRYASDKAALRWWHILSAMYPVVHHLEERAPHVGLSWRLIADENGAAAPGATWTRQGTRNFPRNNTIQPYSALGAGQETQQHVMQSQSPSKRWYIGAFAEQSSGDGTTTRTTHNAEHGRHITSEGGREEIDNSVPH